MEPGELLRIIERSTAFELAQAPDPLVERGDVRAALLELAAQLLGVEPAGAVLTLELASFVRRHEPTASAGRRALARSSRRADRPLLSTLSLLTALGLLSLLSTLTLTLLPLLTALSLLSLLTTLSLLPLLTTLLPLLSFLLAALALLLGLAATLAGQPVT
jgi:hypothetical protein